MKSFKEDFEDFTTNGGSKNVPSLNEKIFQKVKRDLNPSKFLVFSKLFGIHILVAALSLLICPQFGLQVFRHQPNLGDVFATFGEFGCHLACGFFFMGSSLLIASMILSREEVRKIRKNKILFLGTLAFVSLNLILISSPQAIFQGIAAAWFIGAILSSSLFLELGWKLRTN